LLIVIDYLDSGTRVRDRRAALVQAKVLKNAKLRPSGKEWLQHELLAWLPSFNFVDMGYDPKSRNLASAPPVGIPVLTAEYGAIELKRPSVGWWQFVPVQSSSKFDHQISLAEYLAEMATGGGTCSRKAIEGGADDWSFTVDELLRVTAAKALKKSEPEILRGNKNVFGSISDTSTTDPFSAGGAGVDPPDESPDEWPDGPISTIRIGVRPADVYDDDG